MNMQIRSKRLNFLARALMLGAIGCASQQGSAGAQPVRGSAGPYEMEVLVNGVSAPTFFHGGESYVMGQLGERYTLRVHNRSARRVEAVVSVDGRDVIDGKPADFRGKRGYLVPAFGFVDVDGWRLSARQAAAFRFSGVPDSYAGRMGNARNVGVIGVAMFPERVYMPRPQPIYPQYRTPYSSSARKGQRMADDSFDGSSTQAAPSVAPSAGSPARSEEASGVGALADNEMKRDRAKSSYRPGLGTEFGEAVSSNITEVAFIRQNSSQPSAMLGLRYNNRDGLMAAGVNVDGCCGVADDVDLRRTASPFPASSRNYATPPQNWQRY